MLKLLLKKCDRERLMQVLTVLLIVAIGILTLDVITGDKDGRRQIVDEDGGEESALCEILSCIKGAGNVDVMLSYDEKNKVTGAIVISDGASNAVVRNDLTNAVAALYNISVSRVIVLEKEQGGD